MEAGESVYNYDRICNTRLPSFLRGESAGEFAKVNRRLEVTGNWKRRAESASQQFEIDWQQAKKMGAVANANAKKEAARNKKTYDRRRCAGKSVIEAGSLVLVRNSQFVTRMRGRPCYRYSGPFYVVRVEDSTVYNKGKWEGEGSQRHKCEAI